MNVIKLYNYLLYITDSFYKYLYYNKKNNFIYKFFIKKKGYKNSLIKIFFCKFRKNVFNKLIKVKKINILIDMLSICFLNNTCFHYKKKIIINSPNSSLNFFLENKILNKIIFLLNYIINKKLLFHNGYLKINYFDFKKKILCLFFLGNCSICNISKNTFNNFILKIFCKIKLLKIIKLNE